MTTARILVVEDFEPFRCFISSLLAKTQGFAVIGEASNGLDAVQKAQELKPDVILLDIGLPKLNGIEVARLSRKSTPTSKIVFLSQDNSPLTVQAALGAGACGFVAKIDAGSELLPALTSVLDGNQFLSTRIRAGAPTGGLPEASWHVLGE
jgi:DNA-binding NarL/FixJ family response regulator